MGRFQQTTQPGRKLKTILPIAVFAVIICIFLFSVVRISDSTTERQKESLENALARDITYCYTVEGTYPEDLAYIEENYGLTYDKDLFFVDYQVSGANIYPDVTIIEKKEK